MHLEFLVEEPSVEVVLKTIVPGIVGEAATFRFHVHQGKSDLLASLPNRLRAYAKWLPDDWRMVVLVDEDREDCQTLKAQLETAAQRAGLTTKANTRPPASFQVVNRIAVEELEAWFFGDVEALCMAYPRIPATLGARAGFRDPDAVNGGTWEKLERVLQRHGYHRGGYPKIAGARAISQFMNPGRNRSRSFQVFREGLLAAVAGV